MRKRYHFWRGPGGRDAWDVSRLIELSSELPIVDVSLGSIEEVDSVYWFDDRLHRPIDRAVVDHIHLIRNVDTQYPIILGPDGRSWTGCIE